MATPPFNPDESKPGDTDVVSQFPAVERAFRDIVEDWILVDHDTNGEHAQVTLPERGSDPAAATDTGFLYTKDDGGDTELYYRDDSGNIIQITQDGQVLPPAVLTAPAGTRMLFQQTAAPTGWTKDTTANLNDTALRIVTGTVGSRTANSAFSTVFGITATDGHALTVDEMPAHTHGVKYDNNVLGPGSTRDEVDAVGSATYATTSTGGDAAHSHGIDLRVNYHDVIIASKD